MVEKSPRRTIVAPTDAKKFNLRLPDGMRERIAAEAEAKGGSMNSEIVTRLQQSFDVEAREVDRELIAQELRGLRREMKEIRALIEQLRKE